MKKPANIIYGLDDDPGLYNLIILGIQHIFVLTVAFVTPVVIVNSIGGTIEESENLICTAMVATGLATILQGRTLGPIGSGYFCPLLNGPAFMGVSLMAAKAGGLSLVFGMTFMAGFVETIFAKTLNKLRFLFPPEVTGTVVTMVGVEVIPVGVAKFMGFNAATNTVNSLHIIIAMATFLSIVSFNIWGKGPVKLFSVILGLGVGYIFSIATGVLGPSDFTAFIAQPFFRAPEFFKYGMTFSSAMIIPFMIAAISSCLKTMGDLTICQKVNDSEWKRTDMNVVSRGILACACGNFISGIVGALGQSVSSASIGLEVATGATSRRISYALGILLILIAFLPKFAFIFAVMPQPVMGALVVFTVCFMIVAGLQIMTSRMLDSRKIFVIGVSIVFGLSVDMLPQAYAHLPEFARPITSSSLTLATVCAIFLNLFLSIGTTKKSDIKIKTKEYSSILINDFMESFGGSCAARPEVVAKCARALNEFIESAAAYKLCGDEIDIAVTFDEYNLDAAISYSGNLMDIGGTLPSQDEVLDNGTLKLSGYLIKNTVDKITSRCDTATGKCDMRFHFVH